jgi:accessory colonization factor AcfC
MRNTGVSVKIGNLKQIYKLGKVLRFGVTKVVEDSCGILGYDIA